MNPKQISLLAAFSAAKVEYVVVGRAAVNAHGYVHATSGMEIFIRPTDENVEAAYGAMVALGLPCEGIATFDMMCLETTVRFGPDRDYVDVFAWMGEMPFDRVWRNRVEAKVEGLTIPFISKSDLIENKLRTGQLRDLVDVEELALLPDVPFK